MTDQQSLVASPENHQGTPMTAHEKESETNEELVNEDSLPQNGEQPDRHQYKEGQLLNLVRVRFPGNAKSFAFVLGKRKIQYGQKVVAMSDRGIDVGYINSFPYQRPFEPSMLPLYPISKVANDEDIAKQKENYQKQKKSEVICQELIEKYKLEMNLTHVEIVQYGKKAVFYFVAPQRVDFRELVKDLVSQLKMRIELRQIGVRDRASAMGGIGPCGRELCCSSFLQKYGQVNIKMAKNQNFSLIASRLNGSCGQLKCCLVYEDDVYSHKRSFLPPEGSIIKAENGDIGKVLKLHILEEQFELLTTQGSIRKYSSNQFKGNTSILPQFDFPEQFEKIIIENKVTIGEFNPLEQNRQDDLNNQNDSNENENENEDEENQIDESLNENENDLLLDNESDPNNRESERHQEDPSKNNDDHQHVNHRENHRESENRHEGHHAHRRNDRPSHFQHKNKNHPRHHHSHKNRNQSNRQKPK